MQSRYGFSGSAKEIPNGYRRIVPVVLVVTARCGKRSFHVGTSRAAFATRHPVLTRSRRILSRRLRKLPLVSYSLCGTPLNGPDMTATRRTPAGTTRSGSRSSLDPLIYLGATRSSLFCPLSRFGVFASAAATP